MAYNKKWRSISFAILVKLGGSDNEGDTYFTVFNVLLGKKERKRPILLYLVEPTVGLEPTTYGLQNRCSTN